MNELCTAISLKIDRGYAQIIMKSLDPLRAKKTFKPSTCITNILRIRHNAPGFGYNCLNLDSLQFMLSRRKYVRYV